MSDGPGGGVVAGLRADVDVRRDALHLRAQLEVGAGETIAVLGPNGAGKTTLLRALAGLHELDAGSVVLAGRVLEDVAADRWVPCERRRLGMVFQDHLLFPHLSALDNVAFGLRSRGVRRDEARRRAASWLERVGLAARAGARPAALSGGEAQRVALARALVGEPHLLLLDEPLAALDASTRAATRRELRAQLSGFAGVGIVVTHDPVEAAALADRLVVLEAGRIAQEGTLAQLTARPRSAYVADLVGVNLFAGRATGGVAVVGGFELTLADPATGDVLVAVDPRAVTLHGERPTGSARNVWAGRVDGMEDRGERVRVTIGGPLAIVAEVTPAATADLDLVRDGPVWVAVKATEIDVFPA
ncbi:MAG TPA: ABC transporter ATP-binding protein [Acidimicrobiales bacterium]|nr:ABC transporter ATP-binding protein [Acidimicrobiales bacterium]